ncbi:MAG: hypothetical protein EXS05_05055 [Planctomycetaceae bacterium]|nr:hypothetical protein [Planctomycetaceae bacterium]
MTSDQTRREFLTQATALAAGAPFQDVGRADEPLAARTDVPTIDSNRFDGRPEGKYADSILEQFRRLNRFYPTDGAPEFSDLYLGKMVPGRREPGQPPVPVIQTDTPRLRPPDLGL